jgi:hypothetical protein
MVFNTSSRYCCVVTCTVLLKQAAAAPPTGGPLKPWRPGQRCAKPSCSAEPPSHTMTEHLLGLPHLLGLGLRPVKGYTTPPNTRGKMQLTGSSASSLAAVSRTQHQTRTQHQKSACKTAQHTVTDRLDAETA